MSTICPKDCQPCIDDLCRGSGTCAITGTEMFDRCAMCGSAYSREFDVECACQPDDDYCEDGPDDD